MTTRIESLTVHTRRIPLVRPFVTAVRTATHIDAMLVEARDSDGRSGWGEAPTSWRVTGESPQSVTAAVEGPLSEAVAGCPIDEPEGTSRMLARALARNSAARMAVDCAVYDLAAQAAGMPLFRYLGGTAAQVHTDMTLSAGISDADIAQMVETALMHRDAGFGTIKVKVGGGGDDVATMKALRTALGDDVILRADANQAWTPEQAVHVIGAWEDLGLRVQLVEQPVAMDDLESLAHVTHSVDTPILADESVWSLRDLKEVILRRAADMVNIKLAKSGGLREGLNLMRLAADSGMTAIVGCMMESSVGISAAASLASAIEAGSDTPATAISAGRRFAHDLDGGLWTAQSPVDGGATYEAETVRLPDEPGLGISALRAIS